MAAILSNVYQFQTYYLGPNLPVEELAQSCLRFKPDFLILGFTQLPIQREIIGPVEYLKKLDQLLPRSITFCLGGFFDSSSLKISNDRNVENFFGLVALDEFLASKSLL
jgi:hypothetical protein